MIEGIKNILQSDLLERYILGEATPEERIRVDILRIDYREIRERLEQLELDLEKNHVSQSNHPPLGTKDAVIKSLKQIDTLDPALNINGSSQWFNKFWLGIAASFFVGAAMVGFTMRSNMNDMRSANEQLSNEMAVLKDNCQQIANQYAFVSSPNTTPIVLENISTGAYQAVVYWNETEKSSMLRCLSLPQLQEDQTYQIWADVNNEMLSIGTFSSGEEIIALGYYEDATSLNITIEPNGGSDHPTLATLTASKRI